MAAKISWFWGGAKGHIVGFGADPKGTLEPPKGTVPFGKGLARTLVCTVIVLSVYESGTVSNVKKSKIDLTQDWRTRLWTPLTIHQTRLTSLFYLRLWAFVISHSTSDKYTGNYWKTGSKNAGAFQRVINGTLSSGEFSRSLAKKMENIGAHSASGFIDQWIYYRYPTFQVVASYHFV